MQISNRDLQTILAALADAIEERDSYRDSLTQSTADNSAGVVMQEYEESAARAVAAVKRYKSLEKRLHRRMAAPKTT